MADTSGRVGSRPAPGYWLADDGQWYPADMHPDPAKRLVLTDEVPPAVDEDAARDAQARRRLAPAWRWLVGAAVAAALVVAAIAVVGRGGGDGSSAGSATTIAFPATAPSRPATPTTGLTSTGGAPVGGAAAASTTTTSTATGDASGDAAGQSAPSPVVRPPDAAPAPTALPTPGASKERAIAVGQSATLPNDAGGDVDVAVDRFDADAGAEVQAANDANPPAPPGTRYVMVHVRATYHAGTQQRVLDALLLDVDWSLVDAAGRSHGIGDATVFIPDALDTFTAMADGASLAGNLVFAVDGTAPLYLRVAETSCPVSCDMVWFKLS